MMFSILTATMLALLYRGPLHRTFFVVFITLFFFFTNLYFIYYFADLNAKPVHEKIGNLSTRSKKDDNIFFCEVTDPLATSALKRTKTEACRIKLKEAACKLKHGLFHDKFPESNCSNHDSALTGVHVGCFQDSTKKRTLGEFTYELKTENSQEKCRTNCYRAGFLYYGLEYGQECFCGDAYNGTKLDTSRCQEYKCTGDESEHCGGFNSIDIYHTGFKKRSTHPKAAYVDVATFQRTEDVKIMFLLQLNGRNERQVKRVLKAIYSPKHLYYIHVDQRQLYMLTEMKAVAAKLENVYVAPDGHSTIWGGASLLNMVIDAIRRSVSIPRFSTWDYLVNLSESDFPVLSLEELEVQLIKNKGMTYLASHGYNTGRFIQKQGFDFVFQECEERMWRIGKRNEFPRNLRVDGGSDWLVLHREFAEYATSNQDLPQKMRHLFASVILPVESFFHTLGYNSHFCDKIYSNHLRLTNWNRKQGCRCASLKNVVDWCGCSPLVFKKEHVSKFALAKTKEKALYIARKFESLIDIDAIAIAEAQVRRNQPDVIPSSHPSFNSTFVNFYKADIDGFSHENTLLAKFLLRKALFDENKMKILQRIDIFRQNSESEMLAVFTIEMKDREQPIQLLVDRLQTGTVAQSAVNDGFQLTSITFGVNIDHKEEIYRGITGFVNFKTSPVVLIKWKRLPDVATTVNTTKSTSPRCKFSWKDNTGDVTAEQDVHPYDSIYGTQFSSLDLSQFSLSPANSGIWTASIHSDHLLATISFPVFDIGNVDEFASLVDKFYVIRQVCTDNCHETLWSTFYPDPKSAIITGYDVELNMLRYQQKSRRFMPVIRPPTDPNVLRGLLKGFVSLAPRILSDESVPQILAREVSTMKEEHIGTLPSVSECLAVPAPVLYSTVFEKEGYHASLFGFSRANGRLPLHDHPLIHGFIKCLRGSILVRSYSFLDSLGKHYSGKTWVKYDGERVLTPNDDCAIVSPVRGNIHEIIALEDGSFFFDLLIPDYADKDCTYYYDPKTVPKVDEVFEMVEYGIHPPREFYCHSISYAE